MKQFEDFKLKINLFDIEITNNQIIISILCNIRNMTKKNVDSA